MSELSAGHELAVPFSAHRDLIAGIGLRRSATLPELRALLTSALAEAGRDLGHVAALATLRGKHTYPALTGLARQLGVPVIVLSLSELDNDAPNPSVLVSRLLGLPSVSEATALAFGPLLVEKRKSPNATCAIAVQGVGRSSAAIAPSTLSASVAGP